MYPYGLQKFPLSLSVEYESMFREWEVARNTSSNAKYRWRCMKASLVLTLLVVACFVARMESASGG